VHATAVEKVTCNVGAPISDCNIMFGDVELIFNISVDLTLQFTADTLIQSGNTIEFAFPGFVANFENVSGTSIPVKFNVSAAPAEEAGMLVARSWDKAVYKPYVNKSAPEPVLPGCFKLAFNDSL
jgi:hypothetical protein